MKRTRPALPLLAAGLLSSLAAATPADAAPPAVRCVGNEVRIAAPETAAASPRYADRQTLVEAIADVCGLRLIRHRDLGGAVQLTGQVLTLPEILEVLLADESYQLLVTAGPDDGQKPRGGALWIFADGDAIPPEAQLLFETVLLQGAFSERRDAVRQLRRLANADAARLLSLALTDPDERVRDAAYEALSTIGGDEALAALASAGASDNAAARAEAAEAIAMAGGESALDYLAAALSDPDPRVRAAALHSLGGLDAPAGRAYVRRALEDPDETVRQAALEALEDMDDDAMFHALFPPE